MQVPRGRSMLDQQPKVETIGVNRNFGQRNSINYTHNAEENTRNNIISLINKSKPNSIKNNSPIKDKGRDDLNKNETEENSFNLPKKHHLSNFYICEDLSNKKDDIEQIVQDQENSKIYEGFSKRSVTCQEIIADYKIESKFGDEYKDDKDYKVFREKNENFGISDFEENIVDSDFSPRLVQKFKETNEEINEKQISKLNMLSLESGEIELIYKKKEHSPLASEASCKEDSISSSRDKIKISPRNPRDKSKFFRHKLTGRVTDMSSDDDEDKSISDKNINSIKRDKSKILSQKHNNIFHNNQNRSTTTGLLKKGNNPDLAKLNLTKSQSIAKLKQFPDKTGSLRKGIVIKTTIKSPHIKFNETTMKIHTNFNVVSKNNGFYDKGIDSIYI